MQTSRDVAKTGSFSSSGLRFPISGGQKTSGELLKHKAGLKENIIDAKNIYQSS